MRDPRPLRSLWLFMLLTPLALSVRTGRADAPQVNRLKNGQFLLGTHDWQAKYAQIAKIDYLACEDIPLRWEPGENGVHDLVVPINQPSQAVRIDTDPFQIELHSPLRVTFEAKCDSGKRGISACLLNADQRISKNFSIGSGWQTFSFIGTFDGGSQAACRFEIRTTGDKGTFFLRNVRVEQDSEGDSKLREAEFALGANKPLALFQLGDEVSYDQWVFLPNEDKVSLDWQLRNREGTLVKSGHIPLQKGVHHSTLSLGRLDLGWYSLKCSVSGAHYRPSPEEFSFAVLPSLASRPALEPENSSFGIHTEVTADGIEAAKLLGAHWIRLHSPLVTKWHAVEEQKGKFTFRDDVIDTLARNGFGIVGTLDRSAAWASPDKDDPKTRGSNYYGAYAYMPADWTAWDTYVTTIVNRYKDKIKYWQIWNEPDIPFLVAPSGMTQAQAYDQIVRRTAPLVRRLEPEATVLGGVAYLKQRQGGPGRQGNFLEQMNSIGTERQLDVLTFHHYVQFHEDPSQIINDLADVQSLFRQDPKLKYWVTEFGFTNSTSAKYDYLNQAPRLIDMHEAAKETVKFHVMAFAHGVERVFYYDAFFDTNGLPGFKDDVNVMWDSKEPRPLVAAYAVMTWLLDGARFAGMTERSGVQDYLFTSGSRSVHVLWADGGAPRTYQAGQAATFYSLDGGKSYKGTSCGVSDEPIYAVVDGPAGTKESKAAKPGLPSRGTPRPAPRPRMHRQLDTKGA